MRATAASLVLATALVVVAPTGALAAPGAQKAGAATSAASRPRRFDALRGYYLDGFTFKEFWRDPMKANRNPLKLAGQMIGRTAVAPLVIPATAFLVWGLKHSAYGGGASPKR